MEHEVNIDLNQLKRLIQGTKKADIRVNYEDYQLGDILKFYNPENKDVGDPDFWVYFRITHIHSGYGLREGYVCLSLERTKRIEEE